MIRRLVAQARASVGTAPATVAERVATVGRFGELLKERLEECASTLTRDTGKPITQSRNEVRATVGRVAYFASQAEEALATKVVGDGEEIRFEALGVVANVSAWNYPYFVGSNVWVPALLAGNAVIYKPSERCVGVGRLVESLWRDAGCEQFFLAEASAGPELVSSPEIDGVCFTGSAATGEKIRRTVHVGCRLQLELGGKDAALVVDDVADVTEVAKALADGAFYNTGQSCCSIERIYVQDPLFDAFSDAFAAQVATFKAGSEWDPTTYLGPLCLATQPAFLQSQVDDALAKGAKILTAGTAPPTPRHFPPTVLTNVTPDMDVARAESFGPIVTLDRVSRDDRDAVDKINDSDFGLTAAVYSSQRDRGIAILKQLKTGTAYLNCCDRSSPNLPWQGRKLSGVGLTMSYLGIQAMAIPRAYHLR